MGTPSPVLATPTQYTWSCKMGGMTLANCSAQKTEPVVNGQCGSSNEQAFAGTPTINLCSSGTASSVTGSGPWSWTCQGSNKGTNANCSAQKTEPVVNGQCGSSNEQAFYAEPSSDLCSVGVASAVSGAGPWIWTCSGINGGLTSNCSTNLRNHVVLVVDDNTYNSLSSEILRFKADIEKDTDYSASVLHNNWANAKEVRDSIVGLFKNEKLAGAILIGNIPLMYRTTEYEGKIYPKEISDYYYQKLDTEDWIEETADTIIQNLNQKSGYSRSIWTSRLFPPNINNFENSIGLLKNYFDKNHEYRTGQLSYDKKMLFVDSQAQGLLDGNDFYQKIRDLADNIPAYTNLYQSSSSVDIAYAIDPAERKQEILEKAKNNYEIMIINIHGSSRSQWVGGDVSIVSKDIIENKPGSLFIALESCSNGNMKDSDYIAGWYLFSGKSLLVRANSTETFYFGDADGLFGPERFKQYQSIASGSNFGEIYRVDNRGQQSLLFGDPTLSIR